MDRTTGTNEYISPLLYLFSYFKSLSLKKTTVTFFFPLMFLAWLSAFWNGSARICSKDPYLDKSCLENSARSVLTMGLREKQQEMPDFLSGQGSMTKGINK